MKRALLLLSACAPYQRSRAETGWRETVVPWLSAHAWELVAATSVIVLSAVGVWRHRARRT